MTPSRRHWLSWAVTRLVGLLGLHSIFPYHTTFASGFDVTSFYAPWSQLLWHGYVPYSQIPILYPPGVIPLLLLPSKTIASYQAEFYLTAFFVDAITFWYLARSGHRRGAMVWLVTPLLLGPVFWARFDLFLAATLVFGVVALKRGHYVTAAVWLSLAGLIKVWPFPLVLVAICWIPRQVWVRYLGAAVATVTVFILPLLLLGAGTDLYAVARLEAGRGLEIESLPALPLDLARLAGAVVPVRVLEAADYGGSAANALGQASVLLFVLGLATALAWLVRTAPRRVGPAEALLLMVCVILASSKVLSAQYLIWAIVACALVVDEIPRPWFLIAALGGALVFTQGVYPFGFYGLLVGSPSGLVIASLHCIAVLALCVVGIRCVRTAAGAGRLPATATLPLIGRPALTPAEVGQ